MVWPCNRLRAGGWPAFGIAADRGVSFGLVLTEWLMYRL